MATSRLKFNRKNWSLLAKEVIETEGVERMERVADACNAYVDSDGYMVSVEGEAPLKKRSYRATVIAANGEAIHDNAAHNRLVNEFHLAGGD